MLPNTQIEKSVNARPQNANLRRGGPGRPKGCVGEKAKAIAALASDLITSPEYLGSLRTRLLGGKAPHMEILLFHYLYGKPKDTVELSGKIDLALSFAERLSAAKEKSKPALVIPDGIKRSGAF